MDSNNNRPSQYDPQVQQPQTTQQTYNQPAYNTGQAYPPAYSYAGGYDASPLSVGQWVITILVTALPIIGIVMLFVWAFGSGNINRRNYARAALIMALVAIILGILFATVFSALFATIFNSADWYSEFTY